MRTISIKISSYRRVLFLSSIKTKLQMQDPRVVRGNTYTIQTKAYEAQQKANLRAAQTRKFEIKQNYDQIYFRTFLFANVLERLKVYHFRIYFTKFHHSALGSNPPWQIVNTKPIWIPNSAAPPPIRSRAESIWTSRPTLILYLFF